jgi:LPS O-antigen subunit length determinant protein (WzzB/FepE family)
MTVNLDNFDDEIDLKELFLALWDKKFFITLTTTVFAIISIIFSLQLPNIYTSKTILSPVNQEQSLSSKLGSNALANITGFDIQGGMSNKTQEAIARIKSFDFFSSYFLPNIKLENIMAVDKWDESQNNLIYDGSLYDVNTNKWVSKNLKKVKPSTQDAYEVYKSILSVSQDNITQFITLSIDHKSPFIAKKWLDIIIFNINENMREKDRLNAKNAVSYLNKSAKSTNIQSLKQVTSNLLESQMQVLMLAASNQAYVFDVLDSPIVPEKKSSPKRSVICILGTLSGFFLSIIASLLIHYTKKYRNRSYL